MNVKPRSTECNWHLGVCSVSSWLSTLDVDSELDISLEPVTSHSPGLRVITTLEGWYWIGDCWRVSLHWPAVPNSTRAPRELIGVPSLSFVHWSLLLCVLSTPLTVPMSLEALHRVLWHPMSAEGAPGMFASSCYDFYWAYQPGLTRPTGHTRDSQS